MNIEKETEREKAISSEVSGGCVTQIKELSINSKYPNLEIL